MPTFITARDLTSRIKYDERYIRERLVGEVFLEGIHYVRPFDRRKILFVWETIEQELLAAGQGHIFRIPLSSGGVCHG